MIKYNVASLVLTGVGVKGENKSFLAAGGMYTVLSADWLWQQQ